MQSSFGLIETRSEREVPEDGLADADGLLGLPLCSGAEWRANFTKNVQGPGGGGGLIGKEAAPRAHVPVGWTLAANFYRRGASASHGISYVLLARGREARPGHDGVGGGARVRPWK